MSTTQISINYRWMHKKLWHTHTVEYQPPTKKKKGTTDTIQSNMAELQKHYAEGKELGTKDITEWLCLYETLGDRKSVVIESKWLPGARAVGHDNQERAQGKLLGMEIFCTMITVAVMWIYPFAKTH